MSFPLFRDKQLADQNYRTIKYWRHKSARQHRLEVPCSPAVCSRLQFYREQERPLVLAALYGAPPRGDSGHVSHWRRSGVARDMLLHRVYACFCLHDHMRATWTLAPSLTPCHPP